MPQRKATERGRRHCCAIVRIVHEEKNVLSKLKQVRTGPEVDSVATLPPGHRSADFRF